MNRIRSTILWMALGAAIASLFWWLERPRAGYEISVRDVRSLEQSLRDIRDRVTSLADDVRRPPGPDAQRVRPESLPSPIIPREAPDGGSNEQILARLASIESTLARLAERPGATPASPREKPAQIEPLRLLPPKPKDQSLINDLLAKGAKEPGANTKTYFGLTPREIQQTLGAPDQTKWETATGHHDWFYYNADGSMALQVRFEGGIVIGVWP